MTFLKKIVFVYIGVGEAFENGQATQMAALDILIRIREQCPNVDIMPYGLVPGWRLNGKVTNDLSKLCQRNQLKSPRFEVTARDCETMTSFLIQLFIADVEIAGKIVY